jgi:hypothetical protein
LLVLGLDGEDQLFNKKNMDDKLTKKIQDWLNTPAQDRDIIAGATMLLQLNHNRVLHANIVRRPERFAGKVEYELRKHLKIRLDGLTVADVVKMEREVVPRVEETLHNEPVISTDAELPEGAVARGKRQDHDQLPPEIQALWDGNIENFHKVRDLHHRLKEMESAPPCDRYEYLKLLDEADKKYRENLAKYDGFVIGQEPVADASDNTADDQDPEKDKAKINAARKSISKWKKALATANEKGDNAKADEAKAKILAAVAELRAAGGTLGDKVSAELANLGIETDVKDDE